MEDDRPPLTHRIAAAAAWALLWTGLWLYSAGPRDLGGPLMIPWHPLVLPFRDGVEVLSGGWLYTGVLWARVAITLGLAWSLRPRTWGAVITVSLVLTSPVFSAMFPPAWHWVFLVAAAVFRWRGWVTLCGLTLGAAVFLDSAFGMSIFARYGFSEVGVPWVQLGILAVMTAAAAAMIRSERWRPGLPLLGAGALFALVAVVAEDYSAHREAPPEPGECDALDVQILDPLEPYAGGAGAFLPRGVAEADDGALAVSGEGVIVVLEPDGTARTRITQHEQYGRIEFVVWDGDTLLAAPSNAAVRIGGGGLHDAEVATWGLGFPEILEPAAVAGRRIWTTVDFPVLLVGEPPVVTYLGGTAGFASFVHPIGDRLFVTDGYSVLELDPVTLEVLNRRRFPLMASRTEGSEDHLFRMEAVLGYVRVMDPDTLQDVARIDTPFTPRYATAGPGTVALADYFGGSLHIYDTETWAPLRTFQVGRRPRNLLWSERRGAFVGVSACGLYEARM